MSMSRRRRADVDMVASNLERTNLPGAGETRGAGDGRRGGRGGERRGREEDRYERGRKRIGFGWWIKRVERSCVEEQRGRILHKPGEKRRAWHGRHAARRWPDTTPHRALGVTDKERLSSAPLVVLAGRKTSTFEKGPCRSRVTGPRLFSGTPLEIRREPARPVLAPLCTSDREGLEGDRRDSLRDMKTLCVRISSCQIPDDTGRNI